MPIDFNRIKYDYSLADIARQEGVSLYENGSEFEACCPFHAEKTPSFTIYNSTKGWKFHCFGCGKHGDSVDFITEMYGLGDDSKAKIEAVKIITGEDHGHKKLPPREVRQIKSPYDGYDIKRPPEGTEPIIAGHRTVPLLNPKRVDPKSGKPRTVTYTPSMVFPYTDKAGGLLGYVLRVDLEERDTKKPFKITPGIFWTVNKTADFEGWSHGSFPSPRVLYNLHDLTANPQNQVFIVEGEKCVEAGKRIFGQGRATFTTWPGGGKAISKVHWKYLRGRSVIIWPDNDEEGWKTVMGFATPNGTWHKGILDYLFEVNVERIKIVHITPEARPEGWDIADAEKEGLTASDLTAIIKNQVQQWSKERFEAWKVETTARVMRGEIKQLPTPKAETKAEERKQDQETLERHEPTPEPRRPTMRGFEIDDEGWRNHLIMKADGDGLKSNSLQNYALLLQYEERFKGIFAWNEFAKEVSLIRRPPWDMKGNLGSWHPRLLQETDIVAAACWLEYCGMAPKVNDIGKIIVRVAEHNSFNPVKDVLSGLVWDGVPRIQGAFTEEGDTIEPWLSHYMGAEPSEINRVFGMKWLIGAVARTFQPGCKVDTMLVLEGPQGLKKSTALRILADEIAPGLFTDEMSDPNSKDAALQMQGAFIVEIAELDAFRKAEITQIKAWLSRQTDRFRRPYGKVVETFHRSCIFAGTVNPLSGTGYLKDPTGARRFWPVAVQDINLVELKRDTLQLWAEAKHLYDKGQQWWLTYEEENLAKEAQQMRYEEDPYSVMIDDFTMMKTSVTTIQIMKHLEIPPERMSAMTHRRIASHLHQRGWRRELSADGRTPTYVKTNKLV